MKLIAHGHFNDDLSVADGYVGWKGAWRDDSGIGAGPWYIDCANPHSFTLGRVKLTAVFVDCSRIPTTAISPVTGAGNVVTGVVVTDEAPHECFMTLEGIEESDFEPIAPSA